MLHKIKHFTSSHIGAFICNMLVAIILFMVARVVFVIYNIDKYIDNLDADLISGLLEGGLKFDLSALFYINGLYAVLYLFPLHIKETKAYHNVLKYIYIIFNSIALAANLCDCVYVRFTGRRTTATVFDEFSNESNLFTIFGTEFLNNFILVIIFILLVWAVAKLYRDPYLKVARPLWKYYLITSISLAITALCAVGAIRGGIDRTTRPITISNANQYVDRPIEAVAVLNTPFSIIRTIGKPAFDITPYMSEADAQRYYTPLHYPADSVNFKQKNVVIFLVESFSRGFIGALNKELNDSTYQGFTPFTDSLIEKSLTFKYSYANGMKSIDGMPSVLSSIPMMIEPFFLTPASLNDLSGVARLLKTKGYHSAFFHGAPNGSMGFQAFAQSTGFDEYYGLDEYCESPLHNGKADFDGAWAIWDYPFFQYYAEEMSKMKEPFVTALFSATSHHPFALPEEYKQQFPEEEPHPIVKCIRYTDESLRGFFEKAKNEPWFNNTLFVITSDHSSIAPHPIFKTDQNVYAAPIIFYCPGDPDLKGFNTTSLAQQTDILPTIMGYLGYDKPYVAFGVDLLNTPASDTYVFNYLSGIYQYSKGDWFLQFDGNTTKAIYNFKKDPYLKENMLETIDNSTLVQLENELKSLVQQYAERMKNNGLVVQ